MELYQDKYVDHNDEERTTLEINEELNAPKTFDECLPVLQKESKNRQSDHYIGSVSEVVKNNGVPPVELDKWAQNTALKDSGYDTSKEAVRQYQLIVMHASEE